MFNDKRWPATKAYVWQRDGGLCRICKREGIANGVEDGYVVSGFACHHVIPFESAKTKAEMERLFFDVNNIILVCKECHAKLHRELGSHTKAKVKERRQQNFERWKDNKASKAKVDDVNK
jgi:5-methylcytosine-specific restriction endonuclease McrA